VLIQLVMVGLLIAFPQMSLVYKSAVPDVDPSKVRIEIPTQEPSDTPDDILKDLQKGGAGKDKGPDKSPEDKATDEIEKALRGGK
jgi:hypothetical protein